MKRSILAVAMAFATFTSAHAASINGLVNTGVGTGAQDTNYHLNAASSDTVIPNTYGYIALDGVWPINPWIENSTTSKWITPTAVQGQSLDANAAGIYTYTLNFDLSGYNSATAAFSGRFAADNEVKISLNGTEIASNVGFTQWHDFAASSGFHAGVNTLDFVVTNWAQGYGNPAGLRVEFTSSNIAAAVPEPDTYGMLLLGAGLVGFMVRRARKQ